MKQIVSILAVALIVGCLTPSRSNAGDVARDARIEQGKLWYDKYCTPCHGAGGAPGSAVFAATKKRVDLRTIAQAEKELLDRNVVGGSPARTRGALLRPQVRESHPMQFSTASGSDRDMMVVVPQSRRGGTVRVDAEVGA
jgi:mono/diheme cytochrome c family protein